MMARQQCSAVRFIHHGRLQWRGAAFSFAKAERNADKRSLKGRGRQGRRGRRGGVYAVAGRAGRA